MVYRYEMPFLFYLLPHARVYLNNGEQTKAVVTAVFTCPHIFLSLTHDFARTHSDRSEIDGSYVLIINL